MLLSDKLGSGAGAAGSMPPRMASLLREIAWLALVAAVLYLTLILFTFSKADPGWSHSATVSAIANSGGRFGAWLYEVGNMDHSVVQGVEAVNRLLGLGEETVLCPGR